MASTPFAEAYAQGRTFRLRQVAQPWSDTYLCCRGEGYDKTALQRRVPDATDEDTLWAVTALFSDGSFKLENVLFDLRLCAHRRLLRDPCVFCHTESTDMDQLWRCESVQLGQGAATFLLQNREVTNWGQQLRWQLVPVGLANQSATLQARNNARAQAPPPPPLAQPASNLRVGAALAAGAAAVAAVAVAASAAKDETGGNDSSRARHQNQQQRRQLQQKQKCEDSGAYMAGQVLGLGLIAATAAAHYCKEQGGQGAAATPAPSPASSSSGPPNVPETQWRQGAPAPQPHSQPQPPPPAQAPQPPQARLELLAARVEEVAEAATVGPLSMAPTWHGELTDLCCTLDSLDAGGGAGIRRALLARIREVSGQIEAREGAASESLSRCAATVAELDAEIEAPSLPGNASSLRSHEPPQWSFHNRLAAVASTLDALECASDAQRSERKRLVRRVEALEVALNEWGTNAPAATKLPRDGGESLEDVDIEATMNAIATMPMPVAQKRAGLSIVHKLLSNVVEHPENEKYRQVRKSNPKVQTALFPQCHELLRLAGFSDAGDALICGGDLPGPRLHEVLLFVDAVLASLPRDSDVPDNAAEQRPAATSAPGPSSSRDVMEVAEDVLATALPAEHVRDGLRTVFLLLSRAKTQPEPGQVQAPLNLQAFASFPLCVDLLLCAGFQDSRDSLVYQGAPKGNQLEVVQDVVLALLQSSSDESREEVTQESSPEPASASSKRGRCRADRFARRQSELQKRRADQLTAATGTQQARCVAQLQPACQQVPLHSIRFSQSSIASAFQNGRSVEETVQQLRCGSLRVEELPTIRVVEHMSLLWSLDNRRLHCMKKAFPERAHPDKLVPIQLESLTNRRVRDEFLKKFTAGTTIVQRGSSQST